jgi:4'-phosphopantetheinyl transferase
MGLFLKENPKNDSILGIWDVSEDVGTLSQMVLPHLNETEVEEFGNFRSEARKKEWLATRLLVKELTGGYQPILHDCNSKPFINNGFHISISHSNEMVGVLLSKKENVGLDIQHISDKIAKIALKFLNSKELNAIDDDDYKVLYLYANWCAKETLLKIYGRKDLDFKKNLKVRPFKYGKSGKFTGRIETESVKKDFDLNYITIKDNQFMLVWYCE